MNFPKLFLSQNVEKKANAMRTGISIAYPHCVNICGFEISNDKNTFVITSHPESERPKTQLNSFKLWQVKDKIPAKRDCSFVVASQKTT